MKPVLVVGAKGLVGTAIGKLLPDALLWDREQLDVTNFPSIHAKFMELSGNISAIINCVAYNDVDGAESNGETARLLNAAVPKQLALFANACRVPLVHFSTGYVFDGQKEEYTEEDAPNPLSVYAQTKREGELLVEEQGGRYYIVRTNVVFGLKGSSTLSKKSFVDIVLGMSEKGGEYKFVTDEVNSITYAPDLAKTVVSILEQQLPYGIYHAINQGSASWYDFAKTILGEIKNTNVELKEARSEEFPRAAKRPTRVVLKNTKLPELRPWQEALSEFLVHK